MRKNILILLSLLSLVFSSSCVTVIPERFEANLKFLATYGYVEYNFRGNVLVADAVLDVQNKKTTQAETDKMLREVEQTILADDRNAMGERQFRSLRYLGGNRFSADQQIKSSFVEDISYFQSEDSMVFVEIIENDPPDDPRYYGEYTIKAFALDDEVRAKMSQLKVSQRGTFSVETDCRVLEHNAHTIARNGRNYIYTWKIEGKRETPAMLTLRAQVPRGTKN
jgi:hypothetical protein